MWFNGLDKDKYDRQYTDVYLAKRIASYFYGYRKQFVIIVVSFVALSILGALQPVWIADGLTAMAQDGNEFIVIVLIGALLFAAGFQYFVNWVRRYLSAVMIGNVVSRMRKDAFSAAVERDLAFYDNNKSGKIVSRITSDTQEFGDVILIASDVVSQLISVSVLLIALLAASIPLTIIMLLTFPMFIGATLLFRRMARNVTRQGSRAMAMVNDNIQETVTGISVAKNFRREAMIYGEFLDVNNKSYQINWRRGFVLALVFPVLNALMGIAIAIVMYAGANYVVWGAISIGSWYLFIQGVDRFFFPLLNLSAFWSQFQQALSSTERIFALIDADNTIQQHDNRKVESLEGAIAFDDVTFAYSDEGDPVLKHFKLNIKPGESVAFVGHTGAGKSTIVKLVTRFYEFQGGTIAIDGQDIRSFDLQSYRSKLGIVPQQPFLFSGTIIDNIRYSRPNATDEEIREVAYSIGGGEWLDTLPDGLHSDVGERGARLSMGSVSLWRWRVCCCKSRPSSSWMKRPPALTRSPRRRFKKRWT